MSKQDKKAQEATQETVVTTNETVTETPVTPPAPEAKAPKAPPAIERSLYPEGTFQRQEAGCLNKLFFPSGDTFIIPEGQAVYTDEATGRLYVQ